MAKKIVIIEDILVKQNGEITSIYDLKTENFLYVMKAFEVFVNLHKQIKTKLLSDEQDRLAGMN